MERKTESNSKKCQGCNSKPIWIPPKSVFTRIANNILEISPPPGYLYCAIDNKGNHRTGGGVAICCDCYDKNGTSQGDCGVKANGGCEGTNCDLSDGCNQSIILPPNPNSGENNMTAIFSYDNPITYLNFKVNCGGFIDITEGVHFVREGEEFLPAAFDAMFELPFVLRTYTAFINRIYNGKKPPKMRKKDSHNVEAINGYCLAVVNIFGRAGIIPLPLNSRKGAIATGCCSNCACNTEDSGCTHKAKGQPCDAADCPACCGSVTDGGRLIYSMQQYTY